MIEGYARWKSLEGVKIDSLRALEETIDILQQNAVEASPIIVEFERTDGTVLSIGLGREKAVLGFRPASGEPPFYVSSSEPQSGGDEEVVVYYFYNAWTEVPRRFLVPLKQAREALRFFLETGRLTKDIVWEEV